MISFNPVVFREKYPAFQCVPPISDQTLQCNWDTAGVYIVDPRCSVRWNSMTQAQQIEARYLMTAHLTSLSRTIASGETPGILTAATVDKVSVTLEPPPAANQWQYWLQSTPYGQQLLALLQIMSVGGFYIGGRRELSAFRRP